MIFQTHSHMNSKYFCKALLTYLTNLTNYVYVLLPARLTGFTVKSRRENQPRHWPPRSAFWEELYAKHLVAGVSTSRCS